LGIVGAILVLGARCSDDNDANNSGLNAAETPHSYFSSMKSMVIEVAYEPGAEPYTGAGLGRTDVWNVLGDNLQALFKGRASVPSMVFPHNLAQMKKLPAQNKESWTTEDLETLAQSQRTSTTTSATGDFFIVFLNGYFDDGTGTATTGPDTDILGVSLGGTTIIGIFKPVVISAASGQHFYVAKFIEQTTLIHEMGHALGLVNAGLPMNAPHQDVANGAHCTNEQCVMYWENEGATAVRNFAANLKHGFEIVFGTECLGDTQNFHP
jgi:hypothetical protein